MKSHIPTDYYIEVRVGEMHAFISLDSADELREFIEAEGWVQTGDRLRRALKRDGAFGDEMSLACGGRGPCCHVGYAHRHCEHCDVVIATQPYPNGWWWSQPYYNQLGFGGTTHYQGQSPVLQALEAKLNQTHDQIHDK